MSGMGFFVVTVRKAGISIGGREVYTLLGGDHFGELALITKTERISSRCCSARSRVRPSGR